MAGLRFSPLFIACSSAWQPWANLRSSLWPPSGSRVRSQARVAFIASGDLAVAGLASSMEIDLHPEADLEFIEASQRYESRVPGLGTRFIDEAEGLKELLLEHPEIGVRIKKPFRRAVFRTFPFSLIYSIEGPLIWIVAVAPLYIHGTRACLPYGEWRVRPGHVILRFLDPIPTTGLIYADRDHLLARIRGVGEAEHRRWAAQ